MISWQAGKTVAVCPITELGFLRISTQPVFGASMKARQMLEDWIKKTKVRQIDCDISALDGTPASSSGKTTDYYLANLAATHGLELASLDENISHPAVFVLPE